MNKNRTFVYFLYASAIVSLFLWLIFNLAFVLANFLNLSKLSIFYINIVPAVIGALCILLAISASTPILNDFLVTMRRLLRFDNLSNPVLLKLSLLAPGTYHHSINVSNLAQAAAKSVSCDSLLVRVAAYYHDIGKLEYPESFIENQTDDERIQPIIDPKKAAQRIIAHVQDGLKIARHNNLSEEICDLINEHHGTTLVNYFFDLAKSDNLKSQREDFRYPGPKPSSKESGILMLADCVEAAARSIKNINSQDITNIVNRIIVEKVEDSQLDNSGLSEIDLKKIKNSLIKTLEVIYHRRTLQK